MSVRGTTAVWRYSRHKGSEKLLLLAIADIERGNGVWASQQTLAEKTGLTDRQVRTLLRKLEASGELAVERRPGRTYLMTVVSQTPEKTSGVPESGTPEIFSGTPEHVFRGPRNTSSDDTYTRRNSDGSGYGARPLEAGTSARVAPGPLHASRPVAPPVRPESPEIPKSPEADKVIYPLAVQRAADLLLKDDNYLSDAGPDKQLLSTYYAPNVALVEEVRIWLLSPGAKDRESLQGWLKQATHSQKQAPAPRRARQ